ncbi:ABC transporter ATP-binding protein [Georgenia thermotolerans]|uniref:ATP-binding cassette domain-containing protein n=1 Tax=Georgenia thermotolerans TaxID=527326 RepID=A0A7J5UV13_9MICO|nr:ABC transporter ATP-binding protein [Georgenia thermotolerans]KAE8766134.1 ATP-binding cassette domain-containing protein [Georgenia thermotolerans]
MSGISVRGAAKVYAGRHGETVALEGVDLELPEHSMTALIGASGCGKSTLLRLLGDLEQPTAGGVLVGGRPPHELRRQGRIGVAFQDAALLPWQSVRKNIALSVRASGRKVDWAEVDHLVRLVGLEGFADARPGQLSGGMRQRVSIARALAVRPQLLLLDEPFGALDELLRTQMNIELQRIWLEQRSTTVIVTHSVGEAVFLADRVVIMGARPGRVVDVVDVPFPRPRDAELMRSAEYHALCDEVSARLAAAIGGEEAAPSAPAAAAPAPVPAAAGVGA